MEISQVELAADIEVKEKDALIVVDMQNDFLPGGALAVKDGDTIIRGINRIGALFSKNLIILTQDWHPPGHQSFASSHEGKKPFDLYETPGIGPVLWPDHCVQGTKGAEFSSELNTTMANLIIRKGYRAAIDSYSTFVENDRTTQTGLHAFLKGLKVSRVFLCGLALDYCVYFSAIDAKRYDFDVVFLLDLTKPVASPEDSVDNALRDMINNRITFIHSEILL
ncbi:MAG: bifunctional nicotinamidase/pyrazinamidase [Candidatus Thorarchaeota archaeon]